jgi:hypothetical protein
LTGAGVQLGFNGWMAYDLLSLADRIKPEKTDFPINTMITFMVEKPQLETVRFVKSRNGVACRKGSVRHILWPLADRFL